MSERLHAWVPAQMPRRWLKKRTVIRLSFAIVLVLLLTSVFVSYRVQRSYSEEALGIYQRRAEKEESLYSLRRTLWLTSIAARDFMLNPNPDRDAVYRAQIRDLRQTAEQLQNKLALPDTAPAREDFRLKLSAYWEAHLRLPETIGGFGAEQKYAFIQREIVPRRNAVGDLLRQFTAMAQQTMAANEAEFAKSRREAAAQLFAILVGCGLIGLVVAWLSLSHSEALERETVEQNRALERGREELRQLTARLMEIQEEERGRLSRELHDEIGQALATLRLEVARAEPVCRVKAPEVLERLSKARELAERTVNSVRNMSALLRPSLLDDLGLEPAIRWLADEFSERTGAPCRVTVAEQLLAGLGDSVSTCVFRVLQEALHNAEKHAGASEVRISGTRGTDRLTVVIEDDGMGFDAALRPSGRPGSRLGLVGMRERVSAAGGELRVESAPGAGTRVELSLPFVPQRSAEAAVLSPLPIASA